MWLGLTKALPDYSLNHMVQYLDVGLDASFAALSDATRRGVGVAQATRWLRPNLD